MQTSAHYDRVKKFMTMAGQATPKTPEIPDAETRQLRANLILEECLETIEALGCQVYCGCRTVDMDGIEIKVVGEGDIIGVADGVADISVVSEGTLIAYGIKDLELFEAVDNNNIAKFGPGHSRRADGKLIKPPGHQPPDIKTIIDRQKGINEPK